MDAKITNKVYMVQAENRLGKRGEVFYDTCLCINKDIALLIMQRYIKGAMIYIKNKYKNIDRRITSTRTVWWFDDMRGHVYEIKIVEKTIISTADGLSKESEVTELNASSQNDRLQKVKIALCNIVSSLDDIQPQQDKPSSTVATRTTKNKRCKNVKYTDEEYVVRYKPAAKRLIKGFTLQDTASLSGISFSTENRVKKAVKRCSEDFISSQVLK